MNIFIILVAKKDFLGDKPAALHSSASIGMATSLLMVFFIRLKNIILR
jgi:hypothetical protein